MASSPTRCLTSLVWLYVQLYWMQQRCHCLPSSQGYSMPRSEQVLAHLLFNYAQPPLAVARHQSGLQHVGIHISSDTTVPHYLLKCFSH